MIAKSNRSEIGHYIGHGALHHNALKSIGIAHGGAFNPLHILIQHLAKRACARWEKRKADCSGERHRCSLKHHRPSRPDERRHRTPRWLGLLPLPAGLSRRLDWARRFATQTLSIDSWGYCSLLF
jgi:hypothetical protein